MNHQFIVMWDCNGLEVCCDVTESQQRTMWQKLKGELPSESGIPSIGHLILRARYNSQRHYEIYVVEAVNGISADDIRQMFEASPQTAADTIRRLGRCMHSDRATDRPVIV